MDGDYVGFIYTGHDEVPISNIAVNELRDRQGLQLKDGFLTLMFDNPYTSVSLPQVGGVYSFNNYQSMNVFNIKIETCGVGNEYNVSNLMYDRSIDQSDAFNLVDMLNPISDNGFVTAFNAYMTDNNLKDLYFAIFRKHFDGESVKYMPVCYHQLENVVEVNKEHRFDLPEPCAVKKNDYLGFGSMKSGIQSIKYDKGENYPCKLLNYFQTESNMECNRKYSIGYFYHPIVHISI
ncbi:MAG: hypothetical protein MHPSP_000436 [Paramarteilia canceri]